MTKFFLKCSAPVAIGLLLLSSGCKKPSQSGPALRELRVRLDWTPWAPHAALFAAQDQGYFRNEGLKVTLYVPPDTDATVKLIAAGQDDIGISYMTDTIFAREQGFKVMSIGVLVPHPLNCIMTLKKSGIDTPSKLKGKIIGTTGVPSDGAFLDDVLKTGGVHKGQYKLVNLGFDLAPALKSGNVDAIVGAYYPWEGINLEQNGYPVNVMMLQEYGVPDYYELVMIAREDMGKKNPEVLRKFLRAAARGQDYVKTHPEQTIQILRAASPDLKVEFLRSSLQKMAPLMEYTGGTFHQDGKKWDQMVEFMQASHLLTKPVDPNSAYSNEFLP
jgi:putative hydroxymethylpyrimidine transport system substrate-binding protein